MARRKNQIEINTSAFMEYAEKLERLGADLQEVFTQAMEEAGAKVAEETVRAVENANLPAHGRYSRGETMDQVIKAPTVKWSGSLGELPLGFDKTKPGAGGFLITGTPKMQPDHALQKIYGTKKYDTQVRNEIKAKLQEEIDKRLGG